MPLCTSYKLIHVVLSILILLIRSMIQIKINHLQSPPNQHTISFLHGEGGQIHNSHSPTLIVFTEQHIRIVNTAPCDVTLAWFAYILQWYIYISDCSFLRFLDLLRLTNGWYFCNAHPPEAIRNTGNIH